MGVLKPGVTAIIATLFEPPTLGPLADAFKADGAQVIIVQGERTNVAWQHGLDRANTRYVMIANDDIEVCPRSFVPRLLAHHKRGFTHLLPTMWRGMNVVTTDGQGFTHGPGWAQPKTRYEMHPMDKGHFISLDRIVPVPAIPAELTVFYGDDWLYWWHRKRGRPALVTDVQIKSGGDLTLPGFDGLSGFTQNHPGLDETLGEPFKDIAEREHAAAPKYFTFYRDKPIPNRAGWYGFSSGLKPDPTKHFTKAFDPLPNKGGIDSEKLLEEILAWELGMAPALRETLHRLLAYTGPLGTVMDIGAHWGAVSIFAAKLGAKKVIAVEADPENYANLIDAVAYYGLQDQITCIHGAVTQVSGQTVALLKQGGSGQRSVLFGDAGEANAEVQSIGFCDLIEKYGPIDYCKIDVEGAEHLFMLDDERTMAALGQIKTLDMELHGGMLYDGGGLTKEMEKRTDAVLEKIGVPNDGYVAHGKVSVSVGA